MIVGAIQPWFGGKRTLAPAIVTELGQHTQYFEPCCGSMAVLFAKAPSQKETVNDLHGDLINLARVLQVRDAAEDLYDRLGRVMFTEDLLNQSALFLGNSTITLLPDGGLHDEAAQIERAYWYFIAGWMGRNGTAGTARVDYQIAVRWTKNGGSPTVRWRNAVDSIPAWHQRLLNVVVLNRDMFKIIDRFEDVPGTAIYVDPPYASSTRSGFNGNYGGKNGEGGRYLHEFNHDNPLFGNDHMHLAKELRRYKKARIVVSYYDCPEVRKLYEGWTFVSHLRHKHLPEAYNSYDRTEGEPLKAKKVAAPEVLIINGPSYATAT